MPKLTREQKMRMGKRAAYLRRCIRASELISMFETDCTVRRRIFEKHIRQEIGFVSYTSFNSMLTVINPEKELLEIETLIRESDE